MNSHGIAVGEYEGICTPDCGGIPQAWMYQQSSGALTQLTFDPSETGASANGISDGGIITGSLIDPSSPLVGQITLQAAASISSNGWIAVNGIDSRDAGKNADTTRAFLLIPAP